MINKAVCGTNYATIYRHFLEHTCHDSEICEITVTQKCTIALLRCHLTTLGK